LAALTAPTVKKAESAPTEQGTTVTQATPDKPKEDGTTVVADAQKDKPATDPKAKDNKPVAVAQLSTAKPAAPKA